MAVTAYPRLETIFERQSHLENSERALSWDRRTLMPPKSSGVRARVIATLREVAAETLCAQETEDLLDQAEAEEIPHLSPWQAANLREMRRKWLHLSALPASLQKAIAELAGPTESAWDHAKRNDDFASFIQPLRRYMALLQEASQIRSARSGLSPYDTFLDEHEPGLRVATVDHLFDDLADFLPPMVEKIAEKQRSAPAPLPLDGPFAMDGQLALSRMLATQAGFDFERGRLDQSSHPYTANVPGDIRITTRFYPDNVRDGIMATIHESGHASYEAGLPEEWHFQPVGLARGGALHESQALIFEMQGSRSAPYVRYLAQQFRERFDKTGPAWTDANVLRAYRQVVPGSNRIKADEVTYPLHIILRYRIERRLLDGSLDIADIPDAWNSESRALLGVTPPSNAQGCLQDPHWVIGHFGYFPVYTIGAVIAAQLFETASQEEPDLNEALGRGDFTPLLRSMRHHVHRHASLPATGDAILEQATGAPLSTRAFKQHLAARYLEESISE